MLARHSFRDRRTTILRYAPKSAGILFSSGAASRASLALIALLFLPAIRVQAQGEGSATLSGRVTDPQSNPVSHLRVQLLAPLGESTQVGTTDDSGTFRFFVRRSGTYRLNVQAPGFDQVMRAVEIPVQLSPVVADVQLGALAGKQESITVTSDLRDSNILFPDPARRIHIRQETLDANPGRPGVPISIPGLPAQTASGGIKAPQYFSPGVAGDHGQPIAQYLQVGTYLTSNNLSANAHGNGYADPNILIPAVLEGVQTDAGAFNVREGNHAVNLSAIYQIRQRAEPFVTVTGDHRDIDIAAGWAPEDLSKKSWIALEAAYGNGFLERLEHRQQYKLNGFREFDWRKHQFTLFGVGYYGFSYIPGLIPTERAKALGDTIDSRQRDQTHTGELVANDVWKPGVKQELQLSGFFRSYNLSLLSNFGDGLIRQSEFRTVAGGNATYLSTFSNALSVLGGLDFQRDAPRRLNLDHYDSLDPAVYGPFNPVISDNVTINDYAPYLTIDGTLWKNLHYNLGWRRDEIQFEDQDRLTPANSYRSSTGFNSPKATVSFLPEGHRYLPGVSASFGQAFFTNDPRIGTTSDRGTPISRVHSYQLVVGKRFFNTDFHVTLGHVTTEATFAQLDADTGLAESQGPGKNEFVTLEARRYFGFGLLQASVSKADARQLDTGLPIAEAPRLIVDVLGTVDKLPFKLQARGEFERVGVRPLGDGFRSVPITEIRGALFRPFLNNRFSVGVNFLVARGYTGQTLQTYALAGEGMPYERIFGVRLPSSATVSCSYHFGRSGLF